MFEFLGIPENKPVLESELEKALVRQLEDFMLELGRGFMFVAIVISSLFSYIWLHLRFAEEHVSNLETQQRLNIMMSQMQPHFLFNTLATIQVLCNTDPKEASAITGKFWFGHNG